MESRRKPLRPAVMAALTRAGNAARTPADDPHLLVEDHLEPRVRIPADLVRSVIAVIEIGLLAGLVAYVTVVGLRGRAHWRTAFLTAVGFYAVARLAATQQTHTTVLSLLATIAIGSAVGSGLRYALGTTTGRPTAAEIATTLSTTLNTGQTPIVAIRRVANGSPEVRRYAATARDGALLDVTVFDRDQQAADAFYRLYRRVRLKANVSRRAPLSLEGAIERQALLIYATEDSGVITPRLRAVIRVGPEAAAIATDHVAGKTLAQLGEATTDDQLRQVWDTVLQLHRH